LGTDQIIGVVEISDLGRRLDRLGVADIDPEAQCRLAGAGIRLGSPYRADPQVKTLEISNGGTRHSAEP
jgi:hypothetical protein